MTSWVLVMVFSSGVVQVPGYTTKARCQEAISSFPKGVLIPSYTGEYAQAPQYERAGCIKGPEVGPAGTLLYGAPKNWAPVDCTHPEDAERFPCFAPVDK